MIKNMSIESPILSVCIPTFNRASILDKAISAISRSIESCGDEVELIISDNCSTDNTNIVVDKYLNRGLKIRYNRNVKNVGPNMNFLKCIEMSSGKYIYLLGDDDYLEEKSLERIVLILKESNVGLLHICNDYDSDFCVERIGNIDDFFKRISYRITFMSGNIFLREVIKDFPNIKDYTSTFLVQMPLYIESAFHREENAFVHGNFMKTNNDNNTNGGYNFYEVFVRHYLNIWKEFVSKGKVSISCYNELRRHLYLRFIMNWNYTLLYKKKRLSKDSKNNGSSAGFNISGARAILKEYYNDCLYYHIDMALLPFNRITNRIFSRLYM